MTMTTTTTLLREGSSSVVIVVVVIFAMLQLARHARTRVMTVTMTLSHGGNNVVVVLSDA